MSLTIETFIPASNFLLVEEEARKTQTEGGIDLPDTYEGESSIRYAKVIRGAVAGAIVAYSAYAAVDFKLDDRNDLKLVSIYDLYGADVVLPGRT